MVVVRDVPATHSRIDYMSDEVVTWVEDYLLRDSVLHGLLLSYVNDHGNRRLTMNNYPSLKKRLKGALVGRARSWAREQSIARQLEEARRSA